MSDETEVQKEEVIGTPEAREASEEKVLYPETDATNFRFMGNVVALRALPIFFAKQIKVALKPFDKMFADTAKLASKGGDVVPPDMDETTVDALMQCAEIICQFYKVPVTRDEMERETTVDELIQLAQAQLEVNGKSDFLLTSLRLITKITGLAGEASDVVDSADFQKVMKDSMTKDLTPSS